MSTYPSHALKIALGTIFFALTAFATPALAFVDENLSIILGQDIPTVGEAGYVNADQNGYLWYSINYGSFTIATNTKAYTQNTAIHGKFVVISDNAMGAQSGTYFNVFFEDDLGFTTYRQYLAGTGGCIDQGTCSSTPFADASGWHKQVFDFGSGTTTAQLPVGNWRITGATVSGAYPPNPYMGVWFIDDNSADNIDTAVEAYQYIDAIQGAYTPPQTRITAINNPISGSLQPTTTVTFDFDYYFNDADFGVYTNTIAVVTDLTMGTTVPMVSQEINASGGGTYSQTATLTSGHYYMWQPKIYGASASVLGNFQTFDVVTYSGQMSFIPPTSTSTIGELTLECGDGFVTGSICNLIGYLFVPSSDVLNKFSGLWDNVKNKPPFGYVTMTINSLTSLDTNSAMAFDLGTVPFQTAIFDPFKIALGTILWALYAIYFYQRRLKTLDI